MSQNRCFFVLLLIPAILTLGLLAFSLSVDWWIDIKEDEVKKYQEKTEIEYKNYKESNIDQGQSNIEWFYIEKSWPLTKRFGLYSKCVEYRKFYLKLSNNFLTTNINSIIKSSSIHYPEYIISNKNQNKPCDDANQVRCYYNNECVDGKRCDSIVDCNDQSDEQFCEAESCKSYDNEIKFNCDLKCWLSTQVCLQEPLCLNRDDEVDLCEKKKSLITNDTHEDDIHTNKTTSEPFKLGTDVFNGKLNCYQEFFDFKSAKTVDKTEILSNSLKDNIQLEYNRVYHLQLIFILTFCCATIFALFAVITLFFALCLSKLCLQCPFWFYGFFSILTLLSSCTGLAVFLYDYYMNSMYKVTDPLKQLPTKSELYRLNEELKYLQTLGISFWTAVSAILCSLLSTLLSFVVCCRLPSIRHDNKEYEIIDYSKVN